MPSILICGDTLRSPELRHEVPLGIGDPFLYLETNGRRAVLTNVLEVGRRLGDAVVLERVGDHDPATVGLQIEERIADAQRHLVAHRGRARRVAVDEHAGHQSPPSMRERST